MGGEDGWGEQGVALGRVDEGVIEAGQSTGCGDAVGGRDFRGVNPGVVGVDAGVVMALARRSAGESVWLAAGTR